MPDRRAALALLAAALALGGCIAETQVTAAQPDGGAAWVVNKPFPIVYSAAARVMNQHGENIREASPDKGRIVAVDQFQNIRGVFLTRLPHGRTRVELSRSLSGNVIASFPGGPAGFLEQMREFIVVFEKSAIAERVKRELEEKRLKGELPPKESETPR